MSTRDLVENYTAYTTAVELNHSAAADSTARTTPLCNVITLVPLWTLPTYDFTI